MVDSLLQISLGTAAIGIFVVCVFYVLVRGMVRMMVATLVIAASAWLAFQAWQIAPGQSMQWTGQISPVIIYGLPVAVFAFAFILLRLVLQSLTRPMAERSDEFRDDRFNPARMLLRLPLLLIPTALILLIAAVVVHHLGSLEEIRIAASHQAPEEGETVEPTYLGRLKSSITRTIPPGWLARLDPSTAPDRITLAKLIAIQETTDPDLEPAIDPTTGQVIPRAIIVEDVELQDLARDRSFGSLLQHPHLEKFLEDPEVRRWMEMLKR